MLASEVFEQLYVESRQRLVVQLTALAGDPSEAQDLVQEAFIRAWQRWDKVGTYEDPEGWIRRVAYNLGVSRWRQARRLVLRPTRAGALPTANPQDGSFESASDGNRVLEAFKDMPVDERRALALHHLAGFSVEEISKETGAPIGTVKSRLSRGRQRLASKLAQKEDKHHG